MAEYDSPDVQPFLQALDEAHQAQTRYDVARQLAAEGNQDVSPRAERVRFQQMVIGLFKRLRPYLVARLERYYEEAKVYDGTEGQIIGLKQLHHYQGAINRSSGFEGDEAYETEEAALLPPQACRNALDLLAECTFQLGFVPEARQREGEFHLGDDDNEQATTNAAGD
jgi:hypothetical protein